MQKNIFVLFLLSFCSFYGVLADQVSCEKIGNHDWFVGNWKTCYMNGTTRINLFDTTIASQHESVEGLYFYNNRKIFFLPIKTNEKFPNLLGLSATFCSLTTISKANFKGLTMLRYLSLSFNQIEKIPSDVFSDLVDLKTLYMDSNKLKSINGRTFAKLTKLAYVSLRFNQCIDETFDIPAKIAALQQTVNEKCSFNELENRFVESTTIVSRFTHSKCVQVQDLTTKTTEVISKLNELRTQHKEECGNIARALEIQAKTLKEQTAEIIELNRKLSQSEVQTMLKMTEVERLREELQRKNEEIIENRQKIKNLEEKNEILKGNNGNYK